MLNCHCEKSPDDPGDDVAISAVKSNIQPEADPPPAKKPGVCSKIIFTKVVFQFEIVPNLHQ